MSAIKQYRRSKDVQELKVGDRLILYHGQSLKAIVINPSGSLLWENLATPQTATALSEKLCQRFSNLTDAQAQTDTSLFLDHLLEHDLIIAAP